MKKCPKCGYKNKDNDATICNLCTARLPERPSDAEEGMAAFSHEPRLWAAGKPRAQGAVERGGTGKIRVEPPSAIETERHYIVPATGEPHRFDVGTNVLVGREDACQVRVLAQKVSRKHVEVKWENGVPTLFDLGSQNGSFVNGEKLESKGKKPLKDGDLIEVGGVQLFYRCLKPGIAESTLKDVVSQATLAQTEEEAGADLAGDASFLPISEILRRLETLQATGDLHVEAGGAKGTVTIEAGKAKSAAFAGLKDAPAIAAVRALTEGRFRFAQAEEDEAPSAKPAAAPARPAAAPAKPAAAPARPAAAAPAKPAPAAPYGAPKLKPPGAPGEGGGAPRRPAPPGPTSSPAR